MARAPDPVLLSDGDLLVPVQGPSGGYGVARMSPEHPDYGGWLQDAQGAQRRAITRAIWAFALQWLLLMLAIGAIVFLILVLALRNAFS